MSDSLLLGSFHFGKRRAADMKGAGEVFNMRGSSFAGQQGGEKGSVCLRKTRVVELTC